MQTQIITLTHLNCNAIFEKTNKPESSKIVSKLVATKELMGYLGSSLIFVLIIGLLVFLAFYEIPENNNDIFKVIVGMIVGSLGVVMSTLAGRNPDEVNCLKRQNGELVEQNKQMTQRVDQLQVMLTDLQSEVIKKLSSIMDNVE